MEEREIHSIRTCVAFPPFDYSVHLQDLSSDHNTCLSSHGGYLFSFFYFFIIYSLPDKTNTPGCLALFVTVNAIDNADALGDELRRSNYRKIEAFIQLLLSKCVCLSFWYVRFFTLVV